MLDDTYAEICFNHKRQKKGTPSKQTTTFKSKQDVQLFVDQIQAQVKLPPLEHEFYLNQFRSPSLSKQHQYQCSKSVLVKKQTKNSRLNSLISDISTLEEGVLKTFQQIQDSFSKEKNRLQEQESKFALLLENLEQKNHITNTNWKTLIKHHFKNLNEYIDFATKDIKEEKSFVYSHQISARNHYMFVDNEIRRNFIRKRQTRI
ncbi:unnamed protein product (macronuclear) [Paramecium tetraurelia]|uniref:Uncharacterized protein n=1 Tax=Paramecium tetraurelia TaxID=5888 RepID=A0BEA2_PARTE|nr:uncharacterized protein GSPATT00027902001 [Paramecium tetraurelia]CAK56869.1 unnamed protein product [Paramecium tetraurelia]|eukprot:XP_001424267.1 hypothetical protein (macronuclear) [Paramecium tetraurelia strain d4-2]